MLDKIKKMKEEIDTWNISTSEKYYWLGKFVWEEIE